MTNEDLEQLDRLIQKRLKARIDPLHERFDAQQVQIRDLSKQNNDVARDLSAQISREAKDLAEIITEGVFPKLAEHDEQIAELQEEIGIKPR
jgi:gas vesicle protein